MEKFLKYLEEQLSNHSIYVWGAQGEHPTKAWIEKKETGTNRANALKMLDKAIKAGCEQTVKAFDCSGLFIYYALNNGLVKQDMTANGIKGKCQKIEKQELKKGCFVFRTYKTEASAKANKRKVGDAYHIGYVADDNLNVIHAKGRAYGVVKEKFNSSYWNYYAIPSWFANEINNSVPKKQSLILSRLLKKGSKGDDVKQLQRCLNTALGCGLAVDGSFGKLTQKAVKDYQRQKKLKVDGIVGKNTCEALGGKWRN